MSRALVVALSLLIAATAPAARAEITGSAKIIDGDTIDIGGQRIRFFGIDAPEAGQTCVAKSEWDCGRQATLALTRMIETHRVSCAERHRDQYQRIVAVCHLWNPDGPDVNAEMVREGWAMAYRLYSTDYVKQEHEARSARRGIWRGTLVAPWDWRVAQQAKERAGGTRAATVQNASDQPKAQTGDCKIKGNISARGERIYHVPGGEYYNATQINTSKGERWFCSEAEAEAAGWRRSKR